MAYFRQATCKLFHKIMTSDSTHPSLSFLAECIVHGAPVQVPRRKPRQDKCSRLIMPYHPALRGLSARLRDLRADFMAAGIPDLAPEVAWSLGGSNISRLCLSDAKHKLDQGGV